MSWSRTGSGGSSFVLVVAATDFPEVAEVVLEAVIHDHVAAGSAAPITRTENSRDARRRAVDRHDIVLAQFDGLRKKFL